MRSTILFTDAILLTISSTVEEACVTSFTCTVIKSSREEIFVEYKKTLNVSKAITEVSDRYKQLEVIKQEQVKQEEIKKQEEETIKKVDEVIKPVEEEKVYELHFKVIGTKDQLLKLKQFLDSEGLKYE